MLYKIVKLTAFLFFSVFSKLQTVGIDQLPVNEGHILVANHFSNLDVFILNAAVKSDFYVLAKLELFKNPVYKFFVHRFNAIPVNRKGFCHQTFKTAIEILQQDKIIAIFPEGHVSNDGTMKRFKHGAAKLALEAKVPIIPVAIIGSNHVLPYGRKIPRPHQVTVRFGKPIYFKNYEQDYDRKTMNEVTERVRNEILTMLNSEGTS